MISYKCCYEGFYGNFKIVIIFVIYYNGDENFLIFDNMKLINELNMIVNFNFFVFFKVEN